MNHPNRDEWIPFVFGEATPQQRRQLAKHLDGCPECAREIAGWRRTLGKLDRWPLPTVAAESSRAFTPFFKWGLAALAILGIGFLAGALTHPARVDVAGLRSQIEASIRSSLQDQLDERWRQFQAQTVHAVAISEARLSENHALETDRVWRRLIDVLNSARAEDSGHWQALLDQAEQRSGEQLVSLRKDLENLATATDDEIRQARLRLIQLASLQESTPNLSP